jgi:hypothetical protein
MKYEELLEDIENLTVIDGIFMKDALLAVVGLHKPNEQGDCYHCTTEYTIAYPCLTIQMIEEELE